MKFPENIRIHDVTLRDGEQQAGLAYNYDDKIRIAEGPAEVGVHRIEAGMPVVPRTTQKSLPSSPSGTLVLQYIPSPAAWWMINVPSMLV